MTETLVERIYEAAFVPDLWPDILGAMAQGCGAAGGAMMIYDEHHARSCQTPELNQMMADFCAQDSWRRSTITLYLKAAPPAAFVHDPDYFPEEVLGSDLMANHCKARGMGRAITTCLALPTSEDAIIVLERSGAADRPAPSALTWLNSLRPHLARSSMVSARLDLERANTVVQTLARLGLPAAVLSRGDAVIATNDLFDASGHPFRIGARDRLSLRRADADRLFQDALRESGATTGAVRSIPLMATDIHGAVIIHVVPVQRSARDVFGQATSVVMVTPVGTSAVPDSAMLHGLFDLSPAEARLVQRLAQGMTIAQVSREAGVAVTTLRTQLRGIFAKTGLSRQTDLSRMVGAMGSTIPRGD